MKKAMFVLGLGLLGSASAQIVTTDVVAGPSFTVMGGLSYTSSLGANVGVMFSDFTNIAGQGITGRFLVDVIDSGITLNTHAFVTFPTGELDFYAGPGLSLGFGTMPTPLTVSLIGGALFPLTDDLNAFAEGGFRFGSTGVFRTGLAYEF